MFVFQKFVFLLLLNFQSWTDKSFILNIFLDVFLEYSWNSYYNAMHNANW